MLFDVGDPGHQGREGPSLDCNPIQVFKDQKKTSPSIQYDTGLRAPAGVFLDSERCRAKPIDKAVAVGTVTGHCHSCCAGTWVDAERRLGRASAAVRVILSRKLTKYQ